MVLKRLWMLELSPHKLFLLMIWYYLNEHQLREIISIFLLIFVLRNNDTTNEM